MAYRVETVPGRAADALELEHGLVRAIMVARRLSRTVPPSRETIFWGDVVVELVRRQLAGVAARVVERLT